MTECLHHESRQVADFLAWRLHTEDYSSAAKIAYRFLTMNADAVDRDLANLPGLNAFSAMEKLEDRLRTIHDYLVRS